MLFKAYQWGSARPEGRFWQWLICCWAFACTVPVFAVIENPGELEEAREQLKELEGTDRARLLLDMVEYHLVDRDFERCREYMERVENLLDTEENPELGARLKLYGSRIALYQAEHLKSLEAAEKARLYTDINGDNKVKAEVFLVLGNIFMVSRDYDKALDYFDDAIEIIRDLGNERLMAMVLNSTGIAYWRLKDWEASENYLRRAREYYREDPRMRYFFNNNIAVSLMEQGKLKEAESLLLDAYQYNKSQEVHYNYALNCSNLGDLYQRMGETEKSMRFLEDSIEKAQEINNLYVLTRSLRHEARLLRDLGDLEGAVAVVEQSVKHAQEIDDPAEEIDSLTFLIQMLEEAGRYKEALDGFREKNRLREEILTTQTRMRSKLFQIRYETAEKEKQMSILEQDRKLQVFQRNGILGGFIIVGIAALGILRRYYFQRKVNRQITEQKAEIEQSHRSLQTANEKLARLNRDKDEILGIAAHDLRDSMGATREVARLLNESWSEMKEDERRQMIGYIIQSTDNMLDIVTKLLDVNRLEREGVKVNFNRVDFQAILEDSKKKWDKSAGIKSQKIYSTPGSDQVLARADPLLVKQIVENLLSNAVKYSPQGASIYLESGISESGESVWLAVRDEGPGLSEEDKSKLFGKFARLSAKPTGGETSTGLGLSIVQLLAKMMHGRVWCESEFGKGAVFYLQLPRFES